MSFLKRNFSNLRYTRYPIILMITLCINNFSIQFSSFNLHASVVTIIIRLPMYMLYTHTHTCVWVERSELAELACFNHECDY